MPQAFWHFGISKMLNVSVNVQTILKWPRQIYMIEQVVFKKLCLLLTKQVQNTQTLQQKVSTKVLKMPSRSLGFKLPSGLIKMGEEA